MDGKWYAKVNPGWIAGVTAVKYELNILSAVCKLVEATDI